MVARPSLLALAAALVACGPPPQTSPAARPTSSAVAAAADPCAELARRVQRDLPGRRPWCARSLVAKARARCPDELGDAARQVDERVRASDASHFIVVSELGGWAVQRRYAVGLPEEARIWELRPDGARLAALVAAEGCEVVDGGGSQPGPDGRFFCGHSELVDLGTGAVRSFADFNEATRSADRLAVVASGHAALLDWKTLEVISEITSPEIVRTNPLLVHGGTSLLVGPALVSFAGNTILRNALDHASPSGDGARVVACDRDTRDVVVVDAATGHELARAAGRCDVAPVLDADGSHAFGAEQRTAANGTTFTPFVLAVASGGVRASPQAVLRTDRLDVTYAALEIAEAGRLCVTFEATVVWKRNGRFRECPWAIDSDGSARLARATDPFAPDLLGLGDGEVARATTADARSVVLAAYTTRTPSTALAAGEGENLRLAVVDKSNRRVVRVIDAIAGRFSLFPSEAESLGGFGTVSIARLEFLDEDHVLLTPGSRAPTVGFLGANGEGYTGSPILFDLASGTKRDIDGNHAGGRWVSSLDGSALTDLLTMQRFELVADEPAWRSVRSLGAACPDEP